MKEEAKVEEEEEGDEEVEEEGEVDMVDFHGFISFSSEGSIVDRELPPDIAKLEDFFLHNNNNNDNK